MYKKILLPTDDSKCANKAAKHAIDIAGISGAELIALNVIDTSSLAGLSPPEELIAEDLVLNIKEMLKEEGHKSLEEISKLVEESRTEDEYREEINLTMVIEEGYPSDIII